MSPLGCSLYRFYKANNSFSKCPKSNVLFHQTAIEHKMNMALQKFAHGANHYCNFKRTALCGENGPFHLISNPSPPPPPPRSFWATFSLSLQERKIKVPTRSSLQKFLRLPPPQKSLSFNGVGGILNGMAQCFALWQKKKKKKKKKIIKKIYVDFKKNFFKDQKNDTHLLSWDVFGLVR